MRNVKQALVLSVAAVGIALSGAGAAFADADAVGGASDSPGFLSGNVIQIPIHIPINLCGNTVDVIALLNPAFGNTCTNR
ncbi:chaplin [Streptacidiphilus sp. EB129]|uniref:chaplin n=1 Tax=Streptacidiphilus sp. EB129 TaxID=3156262 RepID=UPI00351435E0